MDVAAWLGGLGLERYAQAFRDAEITPEVLPELTDADLRELGLPLGPRRASAGLITPDRTRRASSPRKAGVAVICSQFLIVEGHSYLSG